MYSYEDRIRAIELYIKYDLCAADTLRELGYPDRSMLVRWYKEFVKTGRLHERYNKNSKYTEHQMKVAISNYLEHGRSITRTIRAVGYPSRETLKGWIDELAPWKRKDRMKRSGVVQFSQEQKKDAGIEMCARGGSAVAVADRFGASRYSLYKWKKELLGEEDPKTMSESGKPKLPDGRYALLEEVKSLKKQIYRQQMKLDILNKAAEIIKKDQGIDPRKLANKEKARMIDVLRMKYPLNELLRMTDMPKSSYIYQKEAQIRPDKYSSLRIDVKKVFAES